MAYFDQKGVRQQVKWFSRVRTAAPRMRLLELAEADYAAERYHACIPVALEQIDGLLADLGVPDVFSRGHAKALVREGSMTAHPEVLPVLFSQLNRQRASTSTEPISLPERHAIAHGRAIAYDNRVVAAKTRALLGAIRDFAEREERARGRSWHDVFDEDDP